MNPPVYETLKAAPAVTALIGSGDNCRAYPFGFAPQGVQIPYVTWTLVSGQPTNRLTGLSAADNLRVQVDCWGATGKAALQVAEAVRTALESVSHCVSVNLSERDEETRTFRHSMDFEFIDLR